MVFARILTAVVFMLALTDTASALEVIEGDGPSYSIIETSQDEKLIDRIKQTAVQQKTRARRQHIRSVQLKHSPQPATCDRQRLIEVSYIVPTDLKDKDGNIVVAKGQRYNPLEYVAMTSLIVVDGENQRQLGWAVEKQKQLGRAMVLISRGDSLTATKQTGLRVYHLDDTLMEKFGIERVPCIVMQKENALKVSEFAVR
jgi:conjugal transfer pilus assembly protein TraW